MNFFGHAAVASWQSRSTGFVLGAMLPDFATMIRARLPSTDHEELGAGMEFHHVTDAVFHDAPTFRALQSSALAELLQRGVRRGGARAVAHIGVEILLDSGLAESRAHRGAYLDALRDGAPGALGRHIGWRLPVERERFAELRDRLESYGVARRPDAEATVNRLVRVLAGRPRLALDDIDRRHVRGWVEANREEIARKASAVTREVRAGLSRRAL